MLEDLPKIPYQKGDFIGQKYEVYDILGIGGFGVVYLVYSHENGGVYALKTFRDEYLGNNKIRELFRREASVWVAIDRHPYIVNAYLIEEISNRLYIEMEYIPPNEEGLNTLDGYLRRKPPGFVQSLLWGIQFCFGMEYAYSKGVRVHRDIKPDNILITQDKRVKISDFGLAGVLDNLKPSFNPDVFMPHRGSLQLWHTSIGAGIGHPFYMPPEQFTNAAECDERSDIYAFGVVLFQMATKGQLPFLATFPKDNSLEERIRFNEEMYRLHQQAPILPLNSPLNLIIKKCLEKDSTKRYSSFKELRKDLQFLLKSETGKIIKTPQIDKLEFWEWNNKGLSFSSLGRFEEALTYFDKAIELNPTVAFFWSNRASALRYLGRFEEASKAIEKALELDSECTGAWVVKGNLLSQLERFNEALQCLDRVLELEKENVFALDAKGVILTKMNQPEEALGYFDRVLELDPKDSLCWSNKGNAFVQLGRFEEALRCYDKVFELGMHSHDITSWGNKQGCFIALGHFGEALQCCEEALSLHLKHTMSWINKSIIAARGGHLDEALNFAEEAVNSDSRSAVAWHNKARVLNGLKHFEEAHKCYEESLKLDSKNAEAWYNKGINLCDMGYLEDGIRCFEKAIEIEPRDAKPWFNKGVTLCELWRFGEAASCLEKALEIDPRNPQFQMAKKELKEMRKALPEKTKLEQLNEKVEHSELREDGEDLFGEGGIFDQMEEEEEKLFKEACTPKVMRLLKKYDKGPEYLEEIYLKLMVCGVAAEKVIQEPRLIAKYLKWENQGESDLKIALRLSKIADV